MHGFARPSGGAAVIESGVGRGTTVTLYLPRSVKAAEVSVPPIPTAELEEIAPASCGRVLLVEDDQAVADPLHGTGGDQPGCNAGPNRSLREAGLTT